MEIRVKNPWGYTLFSCLESTHLEFQTKRAHIDIITNPYYGRMLFIDGVLQSSEKDEHIYHQMMTYLSNKHFGTHTAQRSYLIAGGSEGAVIRDLLTYNPKKITMVDWDAELVEHMRLNETSWAKGAFLDKRLTLHTNDIVIFLQENEDIYDSVLLDLLDPNTGDDIKWLTHVINLSLKRVALGGAIVANLGGNIDTVGIFCSTFHEFQPWVQTIDVPSFQGTWYILCLRK
jgi:spermidine synthase